MRWQDMAWRKLLICTTGLLFSLADTVKPCDAVKDIAQRCPIKDCYYAARHALHTYICILCTDGHTAET